jgi:hypothetical protein
VSHHFFPLEQRAIWRRSTERIDVSCDDLRSFARVLCAHNQVLRQQVHESNLCHFDESNLCRQMYVVSMRQIYVVLKHRFYVVSMNQIYVVSMRQIYVVSMRQMYFVSMNQIYVVSMNQIYVVSMNQIYVVSMNQIYVVSMRQTYVVSMNQIYVVSMNQIYVVSMNQIYVVSMNQIYVVSMRQTYVVLKHLFHVVLVHQNSLCRFETSISCLFCASNLFMSLLHVFSVIIMVLQSLDFASHIFVYHEAILKNEACNNYEVQRSQTINMHVRAYSFAHANMACNKYVAAFRFCVAASGCLF